MFPHGECAGIATSGRPVVSGGTTGLEVLEIALADWPVPESTKGGTPPRMQPELYKLYGPPPPVDAEYFRGLIGSILMKILLAIRDTMTDPFLCSAPGVMGSKGNTTYCHTKSPGGGMQRWGTQYNRTTPHTYSLTENGCLP